MIEIRAEKKSLRAVAFLLVSGAAAGFCNGFLGAGGGIAMLFAFTRLNPRVGESAKRDNFASVVAAVLPLCLVSAITYSGRGTFSADLLAKLIIPASVGGVTGAFLTDRLNTDILKTVFAVIVIIAGVNMIL